MIKKRLLLAAAVLAMVGCATPAASPTEATSDRPARQRNLITQEEIRESPPTAASLLIRRLRPNWLRGRGASSIVGGGEFPVVYIDEIRNGGLEVLDRISTNSIAQITFIPGRDAATKFGINHGAGAIMIKIRH